MEKINLIEKFPNCGRLPLVSKAMVKIGKPLKVRSSVKVDGANRTPVSFYKPIAKID